ncbi:MAG: hypothetical protein Q7S63_01620 [bacterium]|nr:hypothetical protein [bacterium]
MITTAPLTPEKKNEILAAIYKRQLGDDEYPRIVIATSYHGDEEAYLIEMAKQYGIPLS